MKYSEFIENSQRAFLLEQIAEEFKTSRLKLAREVNRVYGDLNIGTLQKFHAECKNRQNNFAA